MGLETIHCLKCWPEQFSAIRSGRKRFEIRVNDRDFHEGEALLLQEFDPTTQTYTGDRYPVVIAYMVNGGEWGLPENLCVMSILSLIEYQHAKEIEGR